MTASDVGRTRFEDGMRVAREHLDHLQDLALDSAADARESAGLGKVAYGLRVETAGPASVTIGPGLAFDGQGRRLFLPEPRPLDVEPGGPWFLVAQHALRSEGLVGGVPTLLHDDLTIEARAASPPYEDDAVVFARLDPGEDGYRVVQLGQWYLAPLDHGHTGAFLLRQGRWRFDGPALGFAAPLFDSGFVGVEPGSAVQLVHGLGTSDLLVQLQARAADGTITTRGIGDAFWYDLVGLQEVRLQRSNQPSEPLDLRVAVWPLVPGAAGPALPVADPGPDAQAELGASFVLDGSRSRAFAGHTVERYQWTELS